MAVMIALRPAVDCVDKGGATRAGVVCDCVVKGGATRAGVVCD
jgi:hypothetical protein